ncbi:MAG: hypothetical protein RL427_1689 [Bacteroidota bacterium]|jgi:uncharacterized membrane protein YoaK (UPF0700 family)
MFRHHGKNRTFLHNLRLATLLSVVAGIVNITGVLTLKTLTTNVTGHFAFFAEAFFQKNYAVALTFLVFTLFFLMGSFTSNFLAELVLPKKPQQAHLLPILLEMLILIAVAFFGCAATIETVMGKVVAFALLFAMGMQNSLVTKISQSTVRTTHLTGLFTDLGIELSQLFFYKKTEEVKKLRTNIYLRLSIITFFFIGCVVGGIVFQYYQIKTLVLAAAILLLALLYDYFRFQLIALKRKVINMH